MATKEHLVKLRSMCAQNGLVLTDQMLSEYDELVARLLEWNKKINLISRRDEESIWSAHILHSLSILFKLQIPQGAVVLDLGTGGGLPGLPLKIARPDLRFTLIDSTQKKINVVAEIAGSLKFNNLNAVWGRAEDLGRQPAYAQRFDLVVARAVASLRDLVRWSIPFLRQQSESKPVNAKIGVEGRVSVRGPALIALKGGDLEGEMGQIRHLPVVENTDLINLTLRGSQQLEDREKKIVVVNFQLGQSKKRTDGDRPEETL